MSSSVIGSVAAPPSQLSLQLMAPPATAETPLVPVRMVNEFVYCPRLAFLEWIDGEWADSGDTEEGRRAHVRLDAGGGKLPSPEAAEERPDFTARAVALASERLGIIAKMDLIEGEDGTVTPVDTKKGKRPHMAEGAYEPERGRRLQGLSCGPCETPSITNAKPPGRCCELFTSDVFRWSRSWTSFQSLRGLMLKTSTSWRHSVNASKPSATLMI